MLRWKHDGWNNILVSYYMLSTFGVPYKRNSVFALVSEMPEAPKDV